MKRRILVTSVKVPLEGNETAAVDFPNPDQFESPVISVERYNQGQVEILFVEEFAIIAAEEARAFAVQNGRTEIPPEYLGLEEKDGEVDE